MQKIQTDTRIHTNDYVDNIKKGNNNNNNNDTNLNRNKDRTSSLFQKISISANIIKDAISIRLSHNSSSNDHTPSRNSNHETNMNHSHRRSFFHKKYNNSQGGDTYYEDNFNDLSWKCSFGTSENDGIWMNTSDTSGTIMASMVWVMVCKFIY